MLALSQLLSRSEIPAMPHTSSQHNPARSASFGIGLAARGSRVRVVGLTGEHPALAKRLEGMGIHAGSELEILQREGGALIVRIGSSRVALGTGMVHKILVTAQS
ncbi:FeoA family protein [Halothiobacillus neapolitanus]|uniref:FeoA family protein n=1 Tax=Halothiobacillus neapolitanus (strain ATCC 23641 / DSM 15147 / CIP 104769 / NCIMB 8539 / c2) TaxID=555778 RepID=D0KWH2_HALNC|nr:FeoA family protein [Halothiobacillus neapolitanus]ACX94969.1 FeoA family protein [Halothiobacillus neapolitanus c2]TDN61079.1 ferrous iron transport protein A [Halothiobacillus neapolitanus]